jgi:hypothetical protein
MDFRCRDQCLQRWTSAFPLVLKCCAMCKSGSAQSSLSTGTERRTGRLASEFSAYDALNAGFLRAQTDACIVDPFASRYAPYQALVQSNNTLVYVPLDNTAYIRPFYSDQQPELLERSSDGPSNESK